MLAHGEMVYEFIFWSITLELNNATMSDVWGVVTMVCGRVPCRGVGLQMNVDVYIYAINISLFLPEKLNARAGIGQHCTCTIISHQAGNLVSTFVAIGQTHFLHFALSAALSGFFLLFVSAQTQV